MRARSLIVGLLLLSLEVAAQGLPEKGSRATTDWRLPVYNARSAGRPVLSLAEYLGPQAPDRDAKVLLLSFSASFCKPCRKELPWLQKLSDRHRADGLRVVMVSIDDTEEGQKKMAALIEEHGVKYPVLRDRFWIVSRKWLGPKAELPSVFLISQEGTVIATHRGYQDEIASALEGEVRQALGLGAPRPVANTTTP